MVLFPATAWVVTSLTQWDKYLVLVLEAFGVWQIFAAFWLLKSHELMLSQPEERAIRGKPAPRQAIKGRPNFGSE